jgi:diguanylate cyclase (GGDEF)-like protein/PAS domain S-box-containing protein
VTSWNRRLSAAQRSGAPKTRSRADLLAEAEEVGIDPDDQAALTAVANIARDRPGFIQVIQARATMSGIPTQYDFEVRYEPAGPVIRRLGRALVPVDAPPAAAGNGTVEPPAPVVPVARVQLDSETEDGPDVIDILTDTLVETPDLVAVFTSLGHEALWANDAFVTLIPIRESDKIWLVELLDEWSKGHYEVKVLPALVKYGRWRGRLTLLAADRVSRPFSAVIVAHRDREGEIEAVSLVARPLEEVTEPLGATDPTSATARFDALVENATDIICVTTPEGVVEYASPATSRILGYDDGELEGTDLLTLFHPDDAPGTLTALVSQDELGIGEPVELRLRAADESWKHLEVVVSDLTDNPAIGGLVLNARDVTERVEAVQALAAKAYTDALTGLPSRMRILDRLATWLQGPDADGLITLLFDFDRFTSVNDAFGRDAGDEVMKAVAERLRAAVAAPGLVGRLGSDEFVVVLPELGDVDAAVQLANHLRQVIGEPIEIEGGEVEVSASVGIAPHRHDAEADELLLDAGRAMAHAKEAGRDRVEVFNTQLAQLASRRRSIEQQLRRALDHDGVRVHYQPIFDIESETVIGAEALLRVHNEAGGLLSPAEFIEAAESSGLIARLGSQVLHLTCEQLADWATESATGGLHEISVNVSPRQLADPDLPVKVVDALNAVGVAPERLCLEITESILIGAQNTVDTSISYLRALGVRIGLDDFGTGQSSLGYLKRFKLDFVKIDRSLIAGLGNSEQDTAIVRATIELAHNLGFTVVAVGVEFEEQLEALQILGCDRAQGYLFSPPLPADELQAKVASGLGVRSGGAG